MANFTRRAFTRTVLASAAGSFLPRLAAQDDCSPPTGTPTPFVLPKLTKILRKPVSTLNANEVARLRLAYTRLRELTVSNPNDPRGWMQQANVHCWQCGGSGTDIHGSWTFFPWHRAYLYFHERILCKLLNDNSFRLPYWSWDDKTTRSLPTIYRPATIGTQPNSLYDANRSADAVGGASIPNSIFPPNRNPMNSANFSSFGGDASSGGSLEFGPHGAIHMWTGGPDDPYADMGNLSLAARDPIFYAHHCNIDRLWAEFVRRNPVAHANPTDARFLTRSFQFFDESSALKEIRVQDVLDTTPLGFGYPPGAALSKSGIPVFTELLYDPATAQVKLPDALRIKLGAASSVIAVNRSLIVQDVQLPMNSGLYNVFVGDPPAAGADQSTAANYLGYIGIIASHHAHDQHCALVFDATAEFIQRASGSDGATITFAPAGSTQGAKLGYDSIYFIEER